MVSHKVMGNKRFIYYVFTLIISLGFLVVTGQKALYKEQGYPYMTYYSADDYGAHTQNFDIVQDKRGIIYVANFAGILEYDGESWRLITTEQVTKVNSLAVDTSGKVFVGARGEIGYLKPDKIGAMSFVSMNEQISTAHLNFQDVIKTFSSPEGIYFVTGRAIFLATDDGILTWPIESDIYSAFYQNGTLYFNLVRQGSFCIKDRKILPIPGLDKLPGATLISTILPLDNEKLLVGTGNQGLFVLDKNEINRFPTEADNLFAENYITCSIKLSDGTFAFGTSRKGIVVMYPDGKIKKIIDKHAGLPDENIQNLFIDKENRLWAAMNNGLAHLRIPSHLSFFSESAGITGGVADVTRYNGIIYAATYQGLSYYDMKKDLFVSIPGITTACWSVLPAGDYLLAATSKGLYAIKNFKAEIIADGFFLKLYPSKNNPLEIYTGNTEGLHVLESRNGKWSDRGRVPGVDMEVREIVQDKTGCIWINSTMDNIIRYNPATGMIEEFDTASGLPAITGNHFSDIQGALLVNTRNGSFRYDSVSRSFKSFILFAEDSLYKDVWFNDIVETGDGNFYTTTGNEKNITFHKREGESNYDNIFQPFRPIADFVTWVIYPESDDICWFGGPKGLVRYDPYITMDYNVPFSTLIRRIVIKNDSVIFDGAYFIPGNKIVNTQPLNFVPDLEWANNEIRFEFGSTSFPVKGKNQYRYFLDGFDNSWSEWTTETSKEYTSLPRGVYSFHVMAKNIYGKDSEEARYMFYIKTPWFIKWWAIILYMLVLGGILYLVVVIRSRKLMHEKLRLEETVKERTSDLQKTLDNLKETKDQLVQSEKLASLGKLTAGIAHEIQNPLNFVNNFSALSMDLAGELKGNLEKEKNNISTDIYADMEEVIGMIESNVQKINEHGKRADRIVKGMLQHSRGKSGEFQETDMNQLIEEYVNLAFHGTRAENKEFNAAFKPDMDPNVGKVKVVPQDFARVILNIVNNACYAVFEKSRKVQTGYSPEISFSTRRADKNIIIKIKDNGSGIPQSVIDKIFEPFFTTKPTGKGTGLGLSMSYDIISSIHKGKLEVNSVEGESTEFVITIPDNM